MPDEQVHEACGRRTTQTVGLGAGHDLVTRPARRLRRRIPTDESPVGVLQCLRDERGLFGLFGEWTGRRGAIVGHGPIQVVDAPSLVFDALGDLPELADEPGPLLRVGSGWFGYLGYQLGRVVERLPAPATEPSGPSGWLGYYESVLFYDDEEKAWWFEAVVPEGGEDRLEERYDRDVRLLARPGGSRPYAVGDYHLVPPVASHGEAIEAARAYVRAGDAFQVNACMHAIASFTGDALDMFCTGVGRLDPKFGAYFATAAGGICSFSPELFLRVVGRDVSTSPIKGTILRDGDPGRAEAQRGELVRSAKNNAENAMIVDLMRNDLSRVCAPGTVEVADLARAEPNPGLWHLVSDVVGRLRPEVDYGGLLRATFPPGSITGAPKVRAMEIINEIEPFGRGVYTGAIGLSSPVAGLALNVAIRTFEVSGDEVRLGVGGGIVADSVVADEIEECFVKARPLVEATGGRLAVVSRELSGSPGPLGARAGELRPRPSHGVFESMRSVDGTVQWLDRHLLRLAGAVEAVLDRDLPGEVAERVKDAVAGRRGVDRVRLEVRPAGGSLRVVVGVDVLSPSGPGEPPGLSLEPVRLSGGLGRHKWLDRRLLSELRPAWLEEDEQILLVDDDGLVLEAERGNLFAYLDATLRTPGTGQPILNGVCRQWVLEEAARTGIGCDDGPLHVEELAGASEVFVTNALRGVQPVRRVGAVAFAPAHPLGSRLQEELLRHWSAPGTVPASPSSPEGPQADRIPWLPADAGRPGGRRSSAGKVSGSGAGNGPIVVIDNFDSFTYNLVHYLAVLGERTTVVRSTEVTVDEVARLMPKALVISPGPCSPDEAGISLEVVRGLSSSIPTLGVCLGHQCIAQAYGGEVVAGPTPVHGKSTSISHDGSGLFEGVPQRFLGGRYHSLTVRGSSLPECLVVSARSADETVMALRHREDPAWGVQFHPESVLTEHGMRIVENFLRMACSARLLAPARVPGTG